MTTAITPEPVSTTSNQPNMTNTTLNDRVKRLVYTILYHAPEADPSTIIAAVKEFARSAPEVAAEIDIAAIESPTESADTPREAAAAKITSISLDETQIRHIIAESALLTTKEVLTTEEVARYTGVSVATVYKWTMDKEIPHYKPRGRYIYYNRKEIEEWLQRGRVATTTEINDRANRMTIRVGAAGKPLSSRRAPQGDNSTAAEAKPGREQGNGQIDHITK